MGSDAESEKSFRAMISHDEDFRIMALIALQVFPSAPSPELELFALFALGSRAE